MLVKRFNKHFQISVFKIFLKKLYDRYFSYWLIFHELSFYFSFCWIHMKNHSTLKCATGKIVLFTLLIIHYGYICYYMYTCMNKICNNVCIWYIELYFMYNLHTSRVCYVAETQCFNWVIEWPQSCVCLNILFMEKDFIQWKIISSINILLQFFCL